ncbi:MAG: hypothetical protein LLH30_08325 [Candidatus Manganitrophus sp. SA1]|nr:hypothetical protein [Candidatus Manganitrophus morganii]
MRQMRYFIIIGMLFGDLLGCRSSVSPHQNFKDFMNNRIGRKFDYEETRRNHFVKEVELQNGNKEYWFKMRKTCRYMFEVNPESGIVVGMRYEGTEETCAIVP